MQVTMTSKVGQQHILFEIPFSAPVKKESFAVKFAHQLNNFRATRPVNCKNVVTDVIFLLKTETVVGNHEVAFF